MKNLGLKLFSLAVAVMLFAFVNSDANTTVTEYLAPVELRNLPRDKILVAPLGRQVRVTVKGPTALVSRLATTPPAIKVSLPDDLGMRISASLSAESLSLPPYVQVQKIDPQEVDFTFDNLVAKQVNVRVPRIGNVADRLSLDKLDVEPSHVTISGPESELKGITEVDTYPLDLRDIEHDFSRDLALRPHGALTEAAPSSVKVSVKISAVKGTRSFAPLRLEIRSMTGKKLVAAPDAVSVTVSGPVGALNELKAEQVVPFVRVRDTFARNQEFEVQVDLPVGFTTALVEPSRIVLSEVEDSSSSRSSGRR